MKRTIALFVGLITASCSTPPGQESSESAVRTAPPPDLILMSLQAGKNPEGGIAVNSVTGKAYIISEQDIEGDDNYAVFVFDADVMAGLSAPKTIPIPYENEYITVDPARNLIYVPTKFHEEGSEQPDEEAGGDAGETGGVEPPVATLPAPAIVLGTLTVIDGNTNAVAATWTFDYGVEPEAVALDPATGIVYVGTKAPEGEAAADDSCSSGTPIFDVGEPADVECWTPGTIYAFYVDPAAANPITLLKTIPAGDDPESVVFQNGFVYAANEDDGTVTIATAVTRQGGGGVLVTDVPNPQWFFDALTATWSFEPYSLRVFPAANPLACLENQHEADKMAAGGGSVFVTDDRSRVAKITGASVVATVDVPGATVCEYIPNTDGGGKNSSNNIAFMARGQGLVYVASEQNTVAILDPVDLRLKATLTIPGAVHLDGIAADPVANRVWITDEDLKAVFMLQGACANGTGPCVR